MSTRFGLPFGVAVAGLRALRALVAADGVYDAREQALLDAVARSLGVKLDVASLTPASPEEVAGSITDPTHRERLVQAMLITALIDGEATPAEAALVDAFAMALEVDEPRVRNLHHLLHGHIRYLQFDLLRRSPMISDVVAHEWRRAGLRGVWKNVAPLAPGRFLAQDAALAERYRALAALPEGSFGRCYHDHMRERGFTFPGEKAGFPEGFAKHDLCHVLGDYGTDPSGECEVVAFISAFMRHDPFGYLFMIFVHEHLDISVFEGDPTGYFAFEPERVLRALERGLAVNADLYDAAFDWWPLFPRPIDEVRASLGIRPR
jgi:tellurite resistance protein